MVIGEWQDVNTTTLQVISSFNQDVILHIGTVLMGRSRFLFGVHRKSKT